MTKVKNKTKYIILVAAVFIVCTFFGNLRADAAFNSLAKWSGGVYGIGEDIEIEIVLSGFSGIKEITGTVTAELTGFEVISVEATSGFEINSQYRNGKLTLDILNGKSIVVGSDGQSVICLLKCKTEGTASKIAISSTLTGDGVTNTQGQQTFTIKRNQVKVTADPRGTINPGTPTPVPTPTPTMVVWDTPTPTVEPTNTPEPTMEPDEEETATPDNKIIPEDNKEDTIKEDGPASIGSIIFWAIVALVAGIWIGIAIGASIWRKKSIFMTDDEKKVIGKL